MGLSIFFDPGLDSFSLLKDERWESVNEVPWVTARFEWRDGRTSDSRPDHAPADIPYRITFLWENFLFTISFNWSTSPIDKKKSSEKISLPLYKSLTPLNFLTSVSLLLHSSSRVVGAFASYARTGNEYDERERGGVPRVLSFVWDRGSSLPPLSPSPWIRSINELRLRTDELN